MMNATKETLSVAIGDYFRIDQKRYVLVRAEDTFYSYDSRWKFTFKRIKDAGDNEILTCTDTELAKALGADYIWEVVE